MMKFFESPRQNVQYVCVHLEQSQSLCSPVVMLFTKSAVFSWRNSLIPLRAQCAGKPIPLLTRWPVRKGCKPIGTMQNRFLNLDNFFIYLAYGDLMVGISDGTNCF